MKKGRIITEEGEIRAILEETRSIAVLGMSPKPDRDSNMVGRYLIGAGYGVTPVRPGQDEILGQKAVAALDDLEGPVDMINVFRKSSQIMPHAEEALGLKPKVFWMQLGIENMDAAQLLTDNGIDVVMNRCIKVDHERLLG